MGNLLSFEQTFNWEDNLLDRGDTIEELSIALDCARNWYDTTYKTPNLNLIEVAGQNLFEFILYYSYDEKARSQIFPWLTQTQHQTLIGLIQLFQNTTPNQSKDINELNNEFPTENNSFIGFYSGELGVEYIYNENTWRIFHSKYVSTFNRQQRHQQSDYFNEFFTPKLNVDANQINNLIIRKQVPPIFKRLDTPTYVNGQKTLHGEQIQMHFTDDKKSALNIDGTWKHGGCDIPNEAKDKLIEWGFRLPK